MAATCILYAGDCAPRPGMPLDVDGMIRLGEAGRGRMLTRVPLPAGTVIEHGELVSVPVQDDGPGVVVLLIRDQSGYRGDWHLRGAYTPARWGRVVAAETDHAVDVATCLVTEAGPGGHEATLLDQFGPLGCPVCRAALEPGDTDEPGLVGVRVIAWGGCAPGQASGLGGGPEYLISLQPGASIEIVRSGRLYGAPAVLRVENAGGKIVIADVRAEARTSLAGATGTI